ncbi:S1C family serine protease [Facklamia miroungae]|uniref:Serine protease Do n=1 Tax=Facklamia miroungae TaxID=120956 RepID=A0A1G7S401_9LACT|nr:trypsin-like peptidase domain-containing protein [Facklamia miroungae]NKZ29197.1 PDZ domain-containing protein [Facklamia miroungae]SDG16850.1 serine protease Do [Facklamia miroungae]
MKEELNQNDGTKRWRKIFVGLSGMTLSLLLAGSLSFNNDFSAFSQEPSKVESSIKTAEPNQLPDTEQKMVDMVNQASEAVVSIANKQKSYHGLDPFSEYQYNQYFMPDEEDKDLQVIGEGSGVVYRIDGDKAYIVTNHHVVEDADALEVRLKSGETVEAELVGSDTLSDLAVITIDASVASKALEFVDSDNVQVGQVAIAIGSPLGSEFATSVTKGIVSGLDRSVPVDLNGDRVPDWDMSLLQTDAAINPGNSGGALLNSSGQLIGINSSKLSATGVEGMGFAIPSSDVVDIIGQLEKNGEVVRPVLGISYTSLSLVHPDYRTQVMGLSEDDVKGAFIREVDPDGSAAKAGLKEYDLIKAIDGKEIETINDLKKFLYEYKVGDKVKLSIRRAKEDIEVEITLEAAVENPSQIQPFPAEEESKENDGIPY